jgi:hypothetical protein
MVFIDGIVPRRPHRRRVATGEADLACIRLSAT